MSTPRSGACAPWVQGTEIETLPQVVERIAATDLATAQVEALCAEAATAASDILYERTGKIFPGQCGPVTVRPVSRPTDIDTRAWGATLSTVGWVASQGFASAYGSFNPNVLAHYGTLEPPTIELPYAITEIVQVKIDGQIIPSAEYELRDFKSLVRIRPTASTVPTARFGWPTSQIMDLPDTERGTFSVTYMFGNPPPAAGKLAARRLGEYLLFPQLGDTTRLPTRVRQVSRQGISAMVTDVLDLLEKGMLGIYECDAFVKTYNPHGLQRQSAVWSPDLGRPGRRQATV
jgi:hypothetical protein